MCFQKLEDKREGYTAMTKWDRFLEQINNDLYGSIKLYLNIDESKDFN